MKTILTLVLILSVPLLKADEKTAAPSYPPVPSEIKTTDYHDYTGCKLVRVEPDGVVISHDLGTAKLFFVSMPVDFQKAYGYDPVAAKKAMQLQAAKNAASDAAADRARLATAKASKQQEKVIIAAAGSSQNASSSGMVLPPPLNPPANHSIDDLVNNGKP